MFIFSTLGKILAEPIVQQLIPQYLSELTAYGETVGKDLAELANLKRELYLAADQMLLEGKQKSREIIEQGTAITREAADAWWEQKRAELAARMGEEQIR